MNDTDKSKKPEIPKFSSYEEEARWWDNHDPLDYRDPKAPIYVSPGNPNAKPIYLNKKKLEDSMYIRFNEKDLEEIRELANEKGLGATTLVRMWALEKLKDEKKQTKNVE